MIDGGDPRDPLRRYVLIDGRFGFPDEYGSDEDGDQVWATNIILSHEIEDPEEILSTPVSIRVLSIADREVVLRLLAKLYAHLTQHDGPLSHGWIPPGHKPLDPNLMRDAAPGE